MKAYKNNLNRNQHKNTKTPLFSNHGSLTSSIIGKYKRDHKVSSMSKSRVKSITRSPVCEKSPKVQKFMNK